MALTVITCFHSANAVDVTVNAEDFPLEANLIQGRTNDNLIINASTLDIFDQIHYADFGTGDDSIIFMPTDVVDGASFNSGLIHGGGAFRNFEAVHLTAGNDIWSIGDNDRALDLVNGGEGSADILEELIRDVDSDGFFNATDSEISAENIGNAEFANGRYARYSNFEAAAVGLTQGDDTWVYSENDFASSWRWVNGRGGNDTVRIGDRANSSGIHEMDGGNYINFERLSLSEGDNIWNITSSDDHFERVDALGGTDILLLGDGNHNSASVGGGAKYTNFEVANLSDGDNVWTVAGEGAGLEIVNGMGGTDTVEFGGGSHSGAIYREFEFANLSSGNDSWIVTDSDSQFTTINAGGGSMDALEAFITDAGDDGVFNAADSTFSTSSLGAGNFAKYINFETVSVGLTQENDFWTYDSTADSGKGWEWISGRGGVDTISLGTAKTNSSGIGDDGFYRNFEIALLSDSDNMWTVTDGDINLVIDAAGGSDSIVFGGGNHSGDALAGYANFEIAILGDMNDDRWTAGDNDSELEYIDALGDGDAGDTLELGRGDHSAANIGADKLYRNFEQAELSQGGDSWNASDTAANDSAVGYIDALGGADTLFFGNGNHSAVDIGAGENTVKKYRNFEYVFLSDENNTWTVTEEEGSLFAIEAMEGEDTLAFGEGNHSSADIGSIYRGFESVTLSEMDDSWAATEADESLTFIDAGGGADTLEATITDSDADNVLSANDSDFSSSSLGDGIYSNYAGFEMTAAGLSDFEDVWVVTANDSDGSRDWQWINARGANDTIIFGNGNHSAEEIGADKLYRNFEVAALGEGNDSWTVSDEDANLSIDGRGGNDAIVFGDGNHSAANIGGAGQTYTNFEFANLSAGNNVWTFTNGDALLELIDGGAGTDVIEFGVGSRNAESYTNFEFANLSAENDAWEITDGDSQFTSVNAGEGTDFLEELITDAGDDGVFNAADSSFANADLGSGDFAKYLNFDFVSVGLSGGNDVWTYGAADDSGKDWVWVSGRDGVDTLALGDLKTNSSGIGGDGFYRNFEVATLSDGDTEWTVEASDVNIVIDGMNGTDTLAFGEGNHDGRLLAGYLNFESATLGNMSDDRWAVAANDTDLEFIDALGGNDVVVFGTGHHNGSVYRNFERAVLSDGSDSWAVTDSDMSFERIDALEGFDVLENSVADSQGDGVFNGADSEFAVSDLRESGFENYFGFEGVALGLTGGNESWTVSANDTDGSKDWQWVSGREGTDTLVYGDGNHSAAEVGAGEFYRNFELAELSENNNLWTVTGGDSGITVNAMGGDDTIFFGDGTHHGNTLAGYVNFEYGILSNESNLWVAGENDGDLEYIDALGGGDIVQLTEGNRSAATIGEDKLYRNFEAVALSFGNDSWIVTEGDGNLQYIDALDGEDSITFGDGNHSGNDLTGVYRNFERAELSENDNVWTADDNDTELLFIDALNGTDTVILGGGEQSAVNFGDEAVYRNFETAFLSSGNDIWTIGNEDANLSSINASDGDEDTLENPLVDTQADGFFNAADSELNFSDIGSGDFTNYVAFEQVATTLSGGNDVWTVTADDTGARDWVWINASGGDDTLDVGNIFTNSSQIGQNGLYRNFETANLSAGVDVWTVTGGDANILINGTGGNDTLAFGNGEHSGSVLAGYLNFNVATLSDEDDRWISGSNDTDLDYINAMGGADTVRLGDGDHSAADIGGNKLYRGFERVELSDENNRWVPEGDEIFEYIDGLDGIDGVFVGENVTNSSEFGADAKYRNFEVASLTDSNNSWIASDNDLTLDGIEALGGIDTLVLGDGNHSAADINVRERYRNFENVNLSDSDNIWTLSDNDRDLEIVDALGGVDTASLGDGHHSAARIGADEVYRNFELVTLSSLNGSWGVTEDDSALTSIDGLGGSDTLEIAVETDTDGDGVFSINDSALSNATLSGAEFDKYLNFEQVAAGLTGANDTWVASAADEEGDLQWVSGRNGIDTIVIADILPVNQAADSSDIGEREFYRDFEVVQLSNADTEWRVTGGDSNLFIDGLGGNDTLKFGEGEQDGNALSGYLNFERATLSVSDDRWLLGANDSDLTSIDALDGMDTLAFDIRDEGGQAVGGNHSAAQIGSDGLYRNFEVVVLSTANDSWAIGKNDGDVTSINGRGGVDSLNFSGEGNYSAANVGREKLYINFEVATLTENNDTWEFTEGEGGLLTIEAGDGEEDTIAFGQGNHGGSDIGEDKLYRNFEVATLSDEDDSWSVAAGDGNLVRIDAMGGDMDVLEDRATDENGDSFFNASDSDFSVTEFTGGSPNASYANYIGFERAAIGLTDNSDTWVFNATADFPMDNDWDWISGRGGRDTIALGEGMHSSENIGANKLYRHFEVATLSDGDDSWDVTEGDVELTSIDALGGNDTANFGSGNHDGAVLIKYRNFSRAVLSNAVGGDGWVLSDNDERVDYIDGLEEIDTLIAYTPANTERVLSGDDVGAEEHYRNFESLAKNGAGALTIEHNADLGANGSVTVADEGTLVFRVEMVTPEDESVPVFTANSGFLTAGSISTTNGYTNGYIAASDFDVVTFSKTEDKKIVVFNGNTASLSNTSFTDPGLFTDISHKVSDCADGEICLAFEEESGVREEINAALESENTRDLVTAVYRSLSGGNIDEQVSGIVNALRVLEPINIVEDEDSGELSTGENNDRDVGTLLPSEHGGISYEIADLQRTFFDSIEERIVEAVTLLPWQKPETPPTYRVFAGGFEKTGSGDLYELGSRGFMVGVHRALTESIGVGAAASAVFAETIRERVTEEAEGFQGALYSTYSLGRLSGSAILSAGIFDYKSSRTYLLIDSQMFGGITGKTGLLSYGGKLSGGLEILKNLPVRIRPGFSLSFLNVSTDSYTEAGGLGLTLEDSDLTFSEAGTKINIAFNPLKTGIRTVVQPEIEAGLTYDFSGEGSNVEASVAGSSHTIHRTDTSGDLRYFAGGKMIMSDNRNLALKLGYRVDFREGMRTYSGAAQFHIRF